MANISLVTANRVRVVRSDVQETWIAAEAIVAGAPVRLVVSGTGAGRATNANGTSAAEATARGIATKTVAAGEPVTVLRNGLIDGYDFTTLDYDAAIYVSDTDGRLGDVAGTTSQIVGRLVPGTAVTLGTSPDRLLYVNLIP